MAVDHLAAENHVHLMYVGNIADAIESVEFDFSAGFFLSFAAGGGFYCFPVFHEAGGECPQSITGFDCSTAEENA